MTRGSVGCRWFRSCTAPAVALALVLWGCDSAPGPERPGLRGPVVDAFTFGPGAILVDALPPEQVVDGIATVTVTASVTAIDPDADLDHVSFVVRGPDPGSDPIAAGRLTGRGGSRYELDEDIGFPVAVTGRYTLTIYAADRSGRLGNEVRGAIDLLAEGNPPVIDAVEMPERVTRPASGASPVTVAIVVSASDPDGLANLLRVESRVNDAVTLFLCDDGSAGSCNAGFGSSGDVTAGDGRFTVTIQVESTNALGTNTFVFTAVDRSGLRSEAVVRTIEIVE